MAGGLKVEDRSVPLQGFQRFQVGLEASIAGGIGHGGISTEVERISFRSAVKGCGDLGSASFSRGAGILPAISPTFFGRQDACPTAT
jgi:hypothetical protein